MLEILKYSVYDFANTFINDDNQVNWISSDDKKTFKKNCKRYPNRMKYWIDNSFTYTVNKYGFRCSSFDNLSSRKKLMTIGCSYTFGIGMPEHRIWPRLLAEKLNLELYNLSVPGGSADSAYRTIKIWFNKIDPDLVVWFIPRGTLSRSEKFDKNNIYKFGPWKLDKWYINKDYQTWMLDKNTEAIKYLIGTTPLIIQTDWADTQISEARDLSHRGFKDHELLYNEILRKVKNNEYT